MAIDEAPMRVDRSQRTLRELTLEKMREAIVSLRFKPGERLIERDLCAQLGVSRTVVREVLRHLEAEGLVQTQQHRGPIVARPTPEEARQIYEIRGLLEALAARACAEAGADPAPLDAALGRIAAAYAEHRPAAVLAETSEFYRALFGGAGKDVAWGIVSALNARINHLRAMTISTPGRDQEGPGQMRRIVEAIRARDGDAAFAACLAHVERASAIAQQLLAAEDDKPPAAEGR